MTVVATSNFLWCQPLNLNYSFEMDTLEIVLKEQIDVVDKFFLGDQYILFIQKHHYCSLAYH